jgi:putative restriction endonuclease
MVRIFLANTDNAWFDFLSTEHGLAEANFWWPGEKAVRAIGPGELLAFRLKSPRNKIGGFGVFSSHSLLPLQIAWETFGRANGVPSFEALRTTIAALRSDNVALPSTNIGCTVLVQPVFFPQHLWLDLPPSWSPSGIQRGKLYATSDADGLDLWNNLQETARACSAPVIAGFAEAGARYGNPTLVKPRLGQGAFRVAVIEAYGRQCAISDGKVVLPALDAAHIVPYGEGGHHSKSNGILMRKDIHSVFDAGYITVDEKYRLCVSSKIKEVFNNGEEYRRLHGKALRPPTLKADWPDPSLLRWHNEKRFLG